MREGPTEPEAATSASDPDALAETIAGNESPAPPPAEGEALTTTEDGGHRIGRYRLLRPLGTGGMGLVHLAHDDKLDRQVALKVMRPGGTSDPRRLLREARSMARLSHPHIAAVYDVGEHEGDVYVAMEYVQGPTLRGWMEQPRPWEQRRDILLQAAQGLAAAHTSGVVHRDFKPENVIVGADGRVRVLDFGLAKLAPRAANTRADSTDTQIGAIVGTPRYMAPEQLRAKKAGPAADQFAFCLTAYEVVYGQLPFDGESFADVAASVLTQPPREPPADGEAPAALWPLLRQGLQVDVDARHPDLSALIGALEQLDGTAAPVTSRPALRDAREDARARLTQAYADDLIDADELDERLEGLENASVLPAVAALVADLAPAPSATAPALPVVATPAAAAVQAPDAALAVPAAATPAVVTPAPKADLIAIFSAARRAGAWTPAKTTRVFTMFGGSEIDLREAHIDPGGIEINVLVMMGGVEITVPPGTHVQLEVTAIMGGAEAEDAVTPPEPGAPVVRITGFVMFGGVEVCERLPGEGTWAARKRRKAARKALRREAKRKALPPGR